MTATDFHQGPPPHIGWWLCDSNWWRWWNGSTWSHGVRQAARPDTVRRAAAKSIPALNRENIHWSHYWPPGARVPRLAGTWTFAGGQQPRGERTVEVCLRDGRQMVADVWLLNWTDRGEPGDVVAWRHLPKAIKSY